ncbi:hypothetical protein VSU16_14505 (plasmid) [Cetobacterium somerae]|uniref:hypothetical protein n=1 Tax=Cetobacterium somerae TaxID=188913 RepID=UPI002E7C3F0F|nr:hypothetical protein [Cetobacterium somerae]WVJ03132.1 hypothetical protein VSU16_14505 [Cetobacterium somerae]
MARKIKQKINKEEKRISDNLYDYYISNIQEKYKRNLTKEDVKRIHTGLTHFTDRRFRYLSYGFMQMASNMIINYLNEDVAFKDESYFTEYISAAQKLSKKISYDFDNIVLNKNILNVMANKFVSWTNSQSCNNFITTDLTKENIFSLGKVVRYNKEVICYTNMKEYLIYHSKSKKKKRKAFTLTTEKVIEKMVMTELINDETSERKYVYTRDIDYVFMEKLSLVIKNMNLLLKTLEVNKEEVSFVEEVKEVIYKLQRISDYLYFEQILPTAEDSSIISIVSGEEKGVYKKENIRMVQQ